MSLWKALNLTLILVMLFTCAVLIVGTLGASATTFQTPAGGWGFDQRVTDPTPRGDGFSSQAGGSPNI